MSWPRPPTEAARMWYRIGKAPDRQYFLANLALVRISQIFAAASFALFAAGLAWMAHADSMILGLLSFYFSVMYLQHPAFTNTMPKQWISYILAASFAAGAAGYIAGAPYPWLPFSAIYIVLYSPGFKGQNAPPNLVTVAGLAALAFAGEPWRIALSFPAAAALSFIMRVDHAKKRKKMSLPKAASFAAAYLALAASPLPPSLVISLTFAAFLALNGVYLSREPYSWGTLAGRLLPLFSLLGPYVPVFHTLYLGIAVIMFSLCIPLFIPSVFLRRVPRWPRHMPALAIAAAALRLSRQPELLVAAALLFLALGAYVAVKVLKEPSFSLGPPPSR